MVAQRQDKSVRLRLITHSALAPGLLFALLSCETLAADNRFRFDAPMAFAPSDRGGETRIPAARPFASTPGAADYGMTPNTWSGQPEGRLRVKPMNLGGNY